MGSVELVYAVRRQDRGVEEPGPGRGRELKKSLLMIVRTPECDY